MKTSNSRVAIVTDASRGIGAAIARRLRTDGFTVVVNYAASAFLVFDSIGRNATLECERNARSFVHPKFDDGEEAVGLVVREDSESSAGG